MFPAPSAVVNPAHDARPPPGPGHGCGLRPGVPSLAGPDERPGPHLASSTRFTVGVRRLLDQVIEVADDEFPVSELVPEAFEPLIPLRGDPDAGLDDGPEQKS